MDSNFQNNAALILIDIQKGFDDPTWGTRNLPNAEANAGQLLGLWRKLGRPVFHVQHLSIEPNSPLRPESQGCEIKDIVEPISGEPVVTKNVNSAFIGTNLEQLLREANIKQVILAGLTVDHCVNTTARMAANLGFETFVVSDATVGFERTGPDGKHWSADEIHSAALASLHNEFAAILNTKQVLDSAGTLATAK